MGVILRTLILAVCISVAGISASYAQDFKIVTEGSFYLHSTQKLSGYQQRQLRKFKRSGRFHGAFYVTDDGKFVGWQVNMHSLRDAQIYALERCGNGIPKDTSCTLHATLQPDGPSETPAGPVNMSKELAEFVSENLFQFEELDTGFIAVAASRSGNWDISEANLVEADAKRLALEGCDSYALKARMWDGEDLERTMDNIGFYECHIVAMIDGS